LALIGVRPCELAAIEIQDTVLLDQEYRDPDYASRRERLFVVAVNCTGAGGTCFCASMGTGPTVEGGYDLAITEVLHEARHDFVIRTGTDAGRKILEEVRSHPATEAELASAGRAERQALEQMGRTLDTENLPELLRKAHSNPRWDDVARRCLCCGNCTMACPTCFCHTVDDVVDLNGDHAERWREWDSCFNGDYSYVHGGKVRPSIRGRYRQWLTHKLGTWQAQFGSSGCVGCGRCITWCPVGIDITKEVRALRGTPGAVDEGSSS
jgi:ferredoxin